MHVNQGPQSYHLVNRKKSLAGTANGISKAVITRISLRRAISLSLFQFAQLDCLQNLHVLHQEKLSVGLVRCAMMLLLQTLDQHRGLLPMSTLQEGFAGLEITEHGRMAL